MKVDENGNMTLEGGTNFAITSDLLVRFSKLKNWYTPQVNLRMEKRKGVKDLRLVQPYLRKNVKNRRFGGPCKLLSRSSDDDNDDDVGVYAHLGGVNWATCFSIV